ncbi:MAG: hypothetical protein K2J15_06555 [Muribaculaceae bacterium]|nr:hypothetical protein [Muribaculaceae bacterium]
MKENLTDTIKGIIDNGRRWLKLEIEYLKLTATEKITVLMSTLIFGAVCLLIGAVILILLSFALVDVYMQFLSPALSFVCAAGTLLILIIAVYLLRKPLLENPIARLLSKLILDIKPQDEDDKDNK